jgi:hypothetical protein
MNSDMIGNVGQACPKPSSGKDQPLTDEECIVQCIKTLVGLLELYGFESAEYYRATRKGSGFLKSCRFWSACARKCGWMKWAKYKIAAFFSFHTGDTVPNSPDPDVLDNPGDLLCGKAQRFIRRFLYQHRDDPHRRISLLTSVLQSKKGFPRPSKQQLSNAKVETFRKLTTFTPPTAAVVLPDEKGQPSAFTFDDLLTEVRATVRETFKGQKFNLVDSLDGLMPSLSANYNNTRSAYGTLGELIDLGYIHGETVLPEFVEVSSITSDTMTRYLGQSEWTLKFDEYVVDQAEEGRRQRGDATRNARLFSQTNKLRLRDRFTNIYFTVLRDALEEQPDVELVALAEALKVRVISKGPPLTYFCLKPMQRFMWRVLKSHPTFRLIGEYASAKILDEVIGAQLADGMSYLSGDYKAATDNLRGELTEAAWLEICKVCAVPDALATLGLRALTGHTMHHAKLGVAEQRAGQLMGSILSFPILCIVNAAVCRKAISHSLGHRRLPLAVRQKSPHGSGLPHAWMRILPLLINGDDCLFPISERGRSAWRLISGMAGLEESVGKCYFSKNLAQINSASFWRIDGADSYPSPAHFELVGFVNLGLMNGIKRSEEGVGRGLSENLAARLKRAVSLASCHSELLRMAPDWMDKAVLTARFIRSNYDLLQIYTQHNMPWFVPTIFGGVGLTPVLGSQHVPSREDMRTVAAMLYRTHPHVPSPIPLKEAAALRLHEITSLYMDHLVAPTSRYSFTPFDPYDLRPMYLWTVFMMPEMVADCLSQFDKDSTEDLTSALKHNQRVWGQFRGLVDRLPPPLSDLRKRYLLHDVLLT